MTPIEAFRYRRRCYSVVRAKGKCWIDASYVEFADFVRTGRQACMFQVVGFFKPPGMTSLVQVCTGRSFRVWRRHGEWESCIQDDDGVILATPLYCRGELKAIQSMHSSAVSQARAWLRNYVPRNRHYSENILGGPGSDDECLAKSPDFQVEFFEAHRESDPENPYLQDGPWLPEPDDL